MVTWAADGWHCRWLWLYCVSVNNETCSCVWLWVMPVITQSISVYSYRLPDWGSMNVLCCLTAHKQGQFCSLPLIYGLGSRRYVFRRYGPFNIANATEWENSFCVLALSRGPVCVYCSNKMKCMSVVAELHSSKNQKKPRARTAIIEEQTDGYFPLGLACWHRRGQEDYNR